MVEYFGEQLQGFAFTVNGCVQSYGSWCVKPPIIYGDVSCPKAMTVFWSSMAQSVTARQMKGMLIGPVTILNWSFVRNDQPRFLNRAALKTQGDTDPNGSIGKPWRLSTVQQVENLKTLVRIFPLWSTSILLSTTIGDQMSLTVLQALTMDRLLGHHFEIPPSSILVFTLLATTLSLSFLDRSVYPMVRKFIGRTLTLLQRVGLGHTLNFISMAGSALVESKRLHVAHSHHLANATGPIVPMSAMWLVPPLVIIGIGEALHFPGQVALYYQEFLVSMHGTATWMIALLIVIGFYLSTALVDVV